MPGGRDTSDALPTARFTGLRTRAPGQVAGGLSLLEESVEPSTFSRSPQHSFPFLFLGETAFLARKIPDAAQFARRALEHTRGRRERGWEAWTLRLLGDIASHREAPDTSEAARFYQEARAQARQLGMRPLMAHCHLGLGTLYRRTGQRDQAEEYLTTATAMYREMGMRFWVEKAETELKELNPGYEQ